MENKKKFKAEYCPKCNDVKMVKLKDGNVIVLECEKCKFRLRK